MTTTKQLMQQLENGEVSVEEVAEELSTKSFPDADRSAEVDITEVATYDDDSLFWLGRANMRGVLSDADYNTLVEAAG